MVVANDSWVFFEQYLQEQLDWAYSKFDNISTLQQFSAVQAEVKLLKKFLNIKESIRHSMEN